MNSNNTPFNGQNSTHYPFNYPNSRNYSFQNQSSNQQSPQNIPNYGFPPNVIMSSSNQNYCPYYGSIMSYSSQAPPYYSSNPMEKENFHNVRLDEFSKLFTQMDLSGTSGGHEATPNAEDSTPSCRKSPKWTTGSKFSSISEWIKYGTNSVVEIKKVIHIGVKLLISVMSIAYLILPVMELSAEIITTI
ncbi:uncharacterized protein LOC131619350 [Vicia villosa]|uniref:uncharacterized protein LOC131619350 n=1 Tax=Vicia villosa TaxID=3911 RepID=UPI00273C1314|nr:uncharacterized protein LOC131619350 [Vicia villosa]